jgi:hypothetical protein
MIDDIDKMLSYEVKKEMADRYFGFRKMIEADIEAYDQRIVDQFLQLEQRIGFDLIRLYILLKDAALIHAFFGLTGLHDPIFLDPYLLESPTVRRRLFKDQQYHGMTELGRFRNLFSTIYDRVATAQSAHRKLHDELSEEQQKIADEIQLFYRNNDLSTILGFLRSIEPGAEGDHGQMTGPLQPRDASALEQRMRFAPPKPVEPMLPFFAELPPRRKIHHQLRRLTRQAWLAHDRAPLHSILS